MPPRRRAVAAGRSAAAASRPAARSRPVVTMRPRSGETRRRSASRPRLRSVRSSHGPPASASSASAPWTGPSAGRSSSAVVVQPASAPSSASSPSPASAPSRPRSASLRACAIVSASDARPMSAAAARAVRSRQSRAGVAAGRVTVSVDASRRLARMGDEQRPLEPNGARSVVRLSTWPASRRCDARPPTAHIEAAGPTRTVTTSVSWNCWCRTADA